MFARHLALPAVFLALTIPPSASGARAGNVSPQGGASNAQGTWVLQETVIERIDPDPDKQTLNPASWRVIQTGSASATFKYDVKTRIDNYRFAFSTSWTPPPTSLTPGTEVSMSLTATLDEPPILLSFVGKPTKDWSGVGRITAGISYPDAQWNTKYVRDLGAAKVGYKISERAVNSTAAAAIPAPTGVSWLRAGPPARLDLHVTSWDGGARRTFRYRYVWQPASAAGVATGASGAVAPSGGAGANSTGGSAAGGTPGAGAVGGGTSGVAAGGGSPTRSCRLAAGMAYSCKESSGSGGTSTACQLSVETLDAASGTFAGTLDWRGLGSVHRIEGTCTSAGVQFKEASAVKKGKAVLGCRYDLRYAGEVLSGSYDSCSGGYAGNFSVTLGPQAAAPPEPARHPEPPPSATCALATATDYSCKEASSKTSTACTLRLESIDRSGNVEGRLQWAALGSVHKIEGTCSAKRLQFTETAMITRGKAVLGCKYDLTIADGALSGSYSQCSDGYKGTFLVYVK